MPQSLLDKLKSYKKSYGPDFALTRWDYAGNAPGWWIRLGWKGKKPAFQELIYDRDHGGLEDARSAARRLRDRKFIELVKKGVITPAEKRARHIGPSSPHLKPSNKTGIPGLALRSRESKAGSKWWFWEVHYQVGSKPKSTYFGWSQHPNSRFDNPYEAFCAAAEFRFRHECEYYGHSEIDLALIDEFYFEALDNYAVGEEQIA